MLNIHSFDDEYLEWDEIRARERKEAHYVHDDDDERLTEPNLSLFHIIQYFSINLIFFTKKSWPSNMKRKGNVKNIFRKKNFILIHCIEWNWERKKRVCERERESWTNHFQYLSIIINSISSMMMIICGFSSVFVWNWEILIHSIQFCFCLFQFDYFQKNNSNINFQVI